MEHIGKAKTPCVVLRLLCFVFSICIFRDIRVNAAGEATMEVANHDPYIYTRSSTVEDVINDPYFSDFGELLFPVDRTVSEDMTLEEISSSSVYVWYNYIDPDKTLEIIQNLHDRAASGEQVFYDIYSEVVLL